MPDYSGQWKELRSRMGIFLAVWLGGFVVMVALLMALGGAALWLFPVWLAAFFVAGSRWSLFRCPQCGEHFFKPHEWAVNQLAGQCYHCGLRKWANGVDGTGAAPRATAPADRRRSP